MLEALGREGVDVPVAAVAEDGQQAEAEKGRAAQEAGRPSARLPEQDDEPAGGEGDREQPDQVEPEVADLADAPDRVVAGEEGHGRGALLERHPEEDNDEEDEPEGDQPLLGLLGRQLDDLVLEGRRRLLLLLGQVGLGVMLAERPEDDHRNDKADAGDAEPEVIGLAQGVDVALGERPQRFERHGRVLEPGDAEILDASARLPFRRLLAKAGIRAS